MARRLTFFLIALALLQSVQGFRLARPVEHSIEISQTITNTPTQGESQQGIQSFQTDVPTNLNTKRIHRSRGAPSSVDSTVEYLG